MPFAVVNRMIEEYNTNGISSVLRSDSILDLQLSGDSSMFALTDYQKECFKTNNIFPINHGGGTLLAYQNAQSEWAVAHGSSQSSVSATDVAAKLRATYPDQTFEKFADPMLVHISDAMNDGRFKNAYTGASKTWRGGNSGWYDTLSTLGESIHGYDRSRWFRYDAGRINDIAAGFRSLAKSAIFSSEEGLGTGSTRIDGEIDDPETGAPATDLEPGYNASAAKSLAIAARFTSLASTGSSIVCGLVEGLMGVQTMISTYQRLQKLNLASGYLAAVQGVQAGNSNGDAMHEYNKRLTEADPETGKTAMEAAYVDNAFNGTAISAADPSIQTINAETTLTGVGKSSSANAISDAIAGIIGDASGLLQAFSVCNYVKGSLSFVSAGLTIASIFTFGISKVFDIGWKAVVKGVVVAAASAVGKIVAAQVINNIGKMLISDMATDWLGEDLGNALFSSSNALLQANHQIGGGSPGSLTAVLGFKESQTRVIAEEAEYQRATRSPLDITSEYTFMGNIVQSLIPLATSNQLGGAVKNFGSLVSNSVSSLTPAASAIAVDSKLSTIAEKGDCMVMDDVDIRGDVSCTSLIITDETTMNYTPDEIIEIEESWGYITRNGAGAITIKEGTNLEKYINFCGRRVSNWGVADANIVLAQKSKTGVIGDVLSAVGIDINSMIDTYKNEDNTPWDTGQACSNSAENIYWCENRIHQRFIEDQRLAADINPSYTNAVAAYIAEDLEKNPLDNSMEGILARYSGMTKTDVIATLELMDAFVYLAQYHPDERAESVAMAEGSIRAIPQAPAVKTTIATSDDCVPSAGGARLAVVVLTTAGRGPARREAYATA